MENKKELFGFQFKEYDVKECLPPNKSWVLVNLYDNINKVSKVASSFFEKGTFWESSDENSMGIERKSWRFNENKEKILVVNLRVIKWASIIRDKSNE